MSDKNSDIEVIGPEDLEDSPPPQKEEEVVNEVSSTEEPEVSPEEGTVKTEEKKAATPAEDDDPPLENLTAPEEVKEPAPAPAPAPALDDLVGPARPVVTVARPVATLQEVTDDEEEDDDDIDETIAERLLGLTEMFPDFLRTGTVGLVKGSVGLTKSCYAMGRTASWIIFSSAALLFMPIMIETERLQIQDQQKAQKNQMLLGPGTASSGGPSIGPPPI